MAQFPDDQFEHPRRAVRDASRAARDAGRYARRARFHMRCQRRPWFAGTLLLGLGLLFLLDNLNIIEARFFFRNLWPLIIMFFGLSRLFFGQGGERVFGAVATAFGGLWLADRLLDWDINVVGVFWPLILIGLGLNMLFRSPRRRFGPPPTSPTSPNPPIPPVPPVPGAPFQELATGDDTGSPDVDQVDQSASIREVAIMAGIERKNVSQTFRGGSITAVMGSVELDLRDCRMADSPAHIAVQVVMGQVVLRLPRDWTVDSRVGAVLGNIEDRSDPPVSPTPRRLVLDGSLFMGQVEIRN